MKNTTITGRTMARGNFGFMVLKDIANVYHVVRKGYSVFNTVSIDNACKKMRELQREVNA